MEIGPLLQAMAGKVPQWCLALIVAVTVALLAIKLFWEIRKTMAEAAIKEHELSKVKKEDESEIATDEASLPPATSDFPKYERVSKSDLIFFLCLLVVNIAGVVMAISQPISNQSITLVILSVVSVGLILGLMIALIILGSVKYSISVHLWLAEYQVREAKEFFGETRKVVNETFHALIDIAQAIKDEKAKTKEDAESPVSQGG